MAFTYRSGSSAGNSSGGSIAPSKPAGTADGDLLIARVYLEDDTNTWSSVPSGWTLAGSIANTGGFKLWVYWKVASGEPASWTWTPTTNNWRTITVDAYSGGVTPAVDVVGAGGQADGVITTSQTAPSVTSIDDNDLIAFSYCNYSGTNPTVISGFATNLRTAFGGVSGADATKTPAGATGTSWPSSGVGTEDYAAIHIAFKIGAGGTTYSLTVGGTLTPSGSISKQDQKIFVAALSSSGGLSKQDQKSLIGGLTSIGLLSKQSSKIWGGNLTPSGALANIKTVVLTIAGTLSSSGAISKQVNKVVSGTLTPIGTLEKLINRLFIASLSFVGNLANQPIKLVGGVLTSSATLVKQINKVVAGVLSSSGAMSKQDNKTISGTLSASGGLSKQVNKIISGVLSSSGTLTASIIGFVKTLTVGGSLGLSGLLSNRPDKVTSGTITPTGTSLKQPNKITLGSLTPSGTLAKLKVVNLVVSGALGFAGSISKQTQKVMGGTLSTVGGLSKQIRKFFSGALSFIGTFIGVYIPPANTLDGFDVADTRRMPVWFVIQPNPIQYDRARSKMTYDNALLYDDQTIEVYYSGSQLKPFIDARRSPIIYGD